MYEKCSPKVRVCVFFFAKSLANFKTISKIFIFKNSNNNDKETERKKKHKQTETKLKRIKKRKKKKKKKKKKKRKIQKMFVCFLDALACYETQTKNLQIKYNSFQINSLFLLAL